MSDDEKNKDYRDKARSMVDAMIERDADELAAISRDLKQDKVMETTREQLLEGLVQSFVTDLQIMSNVALHYLKHYTTQHEPGPGEILAMLDTLQVAESTKRVAVLTARWNALHPDQMPIGVGELMTKLDASLKEGGN